MSCTIVWVGCDLGDSSDEVEVKNFMNGAFIDSPVQGLTFVTDDTTGVTDLNGTFAYEEDENLIEFMIGSFSLGSVPTGEQVSPLEFGGSGANVYTPIVNNMAALLQSLDSDANPSNGINIESAVADELSAGAINLQSDSFAEDLYDLVSAINDAVNTELAFVHPNDAAIHLAATLDLEDQLEFRPAVKVGRRWEDGLYYAYNTIGFDDPEREYIFNIMGDSVVYNFSGGTAYLMNMEYVGDTLFGYGSLYLNVGTDSVFTPYEYSNRHASPGYIVDHNDTTFISYYNYLKVSGEDDLIEGGYESYLVFNRKSPNQEPIKLDIISDRLDISSPDADDSLTLTRYNRVADTTYVTKIHRSIIEEEKMFLVNLEGSSFLFAERTSGFYPGLISFRKD